MVLPDQEKAVSRAPASPGAPSGALADHEACRISADIARGDESAFAALYDAYHERLYRFALVLTRGDDLLAREALQAAMLTAAAKLRPIESEAHLWNWLARVLRQHLAKTWRQQRRAPVELDLAAMPDVAAAGLDTILEESLDDALLQLATDERQLIEWFYFDDLTHKDIAARLETTPKAVSCRLERLRAELRSLVKRRTA